MSMGIASLMGLGFCICAYCFFQEDLKTVAHRASGGRVGGRKKGPGKHAAAYGVAPTDDDGMPINGSKARKAKKRAQRAAATELNDDISGSYVHVRLEMSSLTQKKRIEQAKLAEADDLTALLKYAAMHTRARTEPLAECLPTVSLAYECMRTCLLSSPPPPPCLS